MPSRSIGFRAFAHPTARRLRHLLPRHGAHAHRAGDGITRGRRREMHAITLETGEALLLAAGPGLVPRDIDVVGDLVAVDRVGAAVAGHAAKERLRLRRGRLRSRGLAAAAADVEHQHAPVGRIVDVAGRVGPEEVGFDAGGKLLAYCRYELPGADEVLAGGVIGHGRSFSPSRRGGKVRLPALSAVSLPPAA